MVSLVAGIVLILLYARSIRQSRKFTVVTGKGYRPRLIHISGRKRYLIPIGLMIYVIVVLLIPLLTLLWASLLPFYTVPSVAALARVGIKNYVSIMHSPGIINA